MPKGRHFNFVIQNPPYGSVGGDTLHLQFVNKCLDIADKQVALFPYGFITKLYNKPSNKFKDKFSKYLTSVDEVKSSLFTDTHMPNVGIYVFDYNNKNDIITINPINSNNFKIDSLLNISEFSDYENEFIRYLKDNGSQKIISAGFMDKRKKELDKIQEKDHIKFLDNKIIESCKALKKIIENKEYSVGLVVNKANGGMNGRAFSRKNGQICKSYIEFVNLFLDLRSSCGYNVLFFNSVKAAENCKISMQNPLLRFTFYKLQDDQMMCPRIYKYVPNINWEDDRVKTDEGLLEVCGCPKDKCKEYADYCKKVIQEVDNNE